MQNRELGAHGPYVSAIGLGCMGMSEFYGPSDETQSINTLHAALAAGINFWDTADMYGLGENERLLSKVLKAERNKVVLATKFGVVRDDQGVFVGVNGRPDYVRSACEASLRRLNVDTIDLYYQHRVDPDVPIEDTVGAMADLVQSGKVRFLGLSEAAADTIRRACAVHSIHAVQTEYSLWSRDIEDQVLPTCRDLGIAVVAYSPLGRGFLSGQVTQRDTLSANDWRLGNPRFASEHIEHNRRFAEAIATIARQQQLSAAQLSLAWLLDQGADIIPIPGTRSVHRLQENAAAAKIELSTATRTAIAQALEHHTVVGHRYPEAMMALVQQ